MSGRTNYGDLTHDAARQIAAGVGILTVEAFPDHQHGIEAVVAYQDLLDSLHHLGRVLLGGDRRILGLRHTGHPDPIEYAAVHLVDELRRAGTPARFGDPRPTQGVAGYWATASRSVRAATDLLGTYRDPGGRPRTPNAAVLQDVGLRRAAYVELAGLSAALANAADQLTLRARAAGTGQRPLGRIPETSHNVLEAAMASRQAHQSPSDGIDVRRLHSVQVAQPGVRGLDPIHELEDRVARLHRVAWQMTTQPHPAIATLTDLAAVGVLVHEAAVGALQQTAIINAMTVAELGLSGEAEVVDQRGQAWRRVHRQIRWLRTPSPGMAGVRIDLIRVQHLLQQITADVKPAGRALPLLLDASSAFQSIAACNLTTLNHLASVREVLTAGAALPLASIGEDTALIMAKIHHTFAFAPDASLDDLRNAYNLATGYDHLDPNPDEAEQLEHEPVGRRP